MASSPRNYAHTKAKRYADPGYQPDGLKRYALDTTDQVRAAWSYINQRGNAAKYSAEDLKKVRANIARAAGEMGVVLSEKP